MALALRLPFDDELLSTLIIEYVAEEKIADRRAFLRSILGCQTSSLVAMPRGLKRLSEETRDYWGKTAEQIARQLTCMPYHLASSSPEAVASALAVMTGEPTQLHDARNFAFGGNSDAAHLRYCRQCVSESRAMGRRQYFRRTHQLPGVAVCPEHGRALTVSTLRASTLHVAGLEELLDVFVEGNDVCFKHQSERGIKALHGVAKRSRDTLINVEPAAYYCLHERYKAQLGARGFLYRNESCRFEDLADAIVDYFGRPYLSWLGLCSTGRETQNWILPLLRESQVAKPTIGHIVLQEFLENNSRIGRKDDFELVSRSNESRHRVDWEARDVFYLAKLKDAANELRTEEPPRRVTAIGVRLRARLPGGFPNQLGKLPQCRQFLARVCGFV